MTTKSILELAYPVGSIYYSFVDINPRYLFGFGSWDRITDRFLYCTTTNIGSTGRSSTHTHNLGDDGLSCVSMHGN